MFYLTRKKRKPKPCQESGWYSDVCFKSSESSLTLSVWPNILQFVKYKTDAFQSSLHLLKMYNVMMSTIPYYQFSYYYINTTVVYNDIEWRLLHSFYIVFVLPFVFRTKLSKVNGSLLGSDKHVAKQVFSCACLTVMEFMQVWMYWIMLNTRLSIRIPHFVVGKFVNMNYHQ